MTVGQFHGGHANLTYLLRFGNIEFVLRRPPFGRIAPGAHDMKREYRVLSRLYKNFPQAPRAWLYCDDIEVIGAPFVLMERRKGIILRTSVPECFTSFPNVERRMTTALINAQAQLHCIDIDAN